MFVPFGFSAYDANAYGLPPVVLENWYPDQAPERPDGRLRLVPTPGAVEFEAVNGTNGRGIFRSDGILGGDMIVTHGATVARLTSSGTLTGLTGTLSNTTPVKYAASQTPQLVVVDGTSPYLVGTAALTKINGTNPATGSEAFPAESIIDVAEINQRHLFVEAGSGRVWYSDTANCETIADTAFFSAENEPDQLLAILIVSGTIILFGSESFELWRTTGNAAIPFASRDNTSQPMGIIGTHAKTAINGTPFFVRKDGAVCEMQGFRAFPIAPEPLVRRIRGLSEANQELVQLSSYSAGNREFVHLYVPTEGDWFFDTQTRTWHRRRGAETAFYPYRYYAAAFGKTYAQTFGDGDIVELSDSTFTDLGSEVRRVATALVPVENVNFAVNRIVIEGQSGVGLSGSGQGSAPLGMLRIARNGRVFENEITTPLGELGEYDHRPQYGPLGQFRPPVAVVEFAVSDPIGYAVYGMQVNPPRL